MNKTILILLLLTFLGLRAQDTININSISDSIGEFKIEEANPEPEETYQDESLTITLPDYSEWNTAKIDGKLKMQGLPLSPSLKIFMQKDSLIDISIRAPFVGEAGRLVFTTDSVVIVNKMNKTFVKENISSFLKYYPGGLSDVQSLLLARFFVPGYDVMDVDLEDLVEILFENNQFNVVPKEAASLPGISYGYIIDELFNPLWLIVLPEERDDIELDIQYIYNLQGYNIIIDFYEGDKKREVTLELKNPEWEAGMPDKISINKKFRQLTFSEFLRAF